MKWVSGEIVFVWGKRYALEVFQGKFREYAIRISGDRMEFSVPPCCTMQDRDRFMQGWYRDQMMTMVAQAVRKWKKTIGIEVDEICVRKMSRCWGACIPSRSCIRLNPVLAQLPVEMVEFQVLHEMCRFGCRQVNELEARLSKHLPGWRQVVERRDEMAKPDGTMLEFRGSDQSGWAQLEG